METSNDWIANCSSNCFNHIAHYRTRYKSGATWRNRADQGSRYPIREEEPTNKPKAAVKVATAPPAQNLYVPPQPTHPPQSIILACYKYAPDQVNSKTEEVVKDAAIGAIAGGTGETLYV